VHMTQIRASIWLVASEEPRQVVTKSLYGNEMTFDFGGIPVDAELRIAPQCD